MSPKIGVMPQVCIHDDRSKAQFELRIYFLEEEGGYAVASYHPYGASKDAALVEVHAAAQAASKRLKIPWVQDATRIWHGGGQTS